MRATRTIAARTSKTVVSDVALEDAEKGSAAGQVILDSGAGALH
jgi:hypothetical protein